MRPLAIDLFTGLHGWAEGCIAEGWRVVGFDLEDMSAQFGHPKPEHFHLVIQDVRTLHGSQFKDAGLLCASPPCQAFSYMAMPWTKAKDKAAAIRADETGDARRNLTELFDTCFRLQREASEAAGHLIPLVIENVRGATPWVGRARWSFGSFYLWGDVPALMPPRSRDYTPKFCMDDIRGGQRRHIPGVIEDGRKVPGFRFDGSGGSFQTASVEGMKVASEDGGRRTDVGKGARFTSRDCGVEAIGEGLKQGGDWFSDPNSASRTSSSKSPARKRASAMIAKIPEALSRHIGRCYFPRPESPPLAAEVLRAVLETIA